MSLVLLKKKIKMLDTIILLLMLWAGLYNSWGGPQAKERIPSGMPTKMCLMCHIFCVDQMTIFSFRELKIFCLRMANVFCKNKKYFPRRKVRRQPAARLLGFLQGWWDELLIFWQLLFFFISNIPFLYHMKNWSLYKSSVY